MSYEAVCPKGHRLQVTEVHFGKRVSCPTCGESFVVPNLGETAAAVQVEPGGKSPGLKLLPAGIDLGRVSLLAGRPMLALGLILVLLARGCDSIGNRGVERVRQKADMAKTQFSDSWDQKLADTDRKLKTILEKAEKEAPTPEDIAARDDLRKSRDSLDKERRKAQETFESTKYRELLVASRDAAAANRMWAYWREIFFVASTILLATGLLVVSWSAQGAERWVCLIMLAILTFSIYIGGVAWIGSIVEPAMPHLPGP
jgi:hypothetical protein